MAQDKKLTRLELLAIISIFIAVVVIIGSVMFLIIYPEHEAHEKFDEEERSEILKDILNFISSLFV